MHMLTSNGNSDPATRQAGAVRRGNGKVDKAETQSIDLTNIYHSEQRQ